MSWPARGPDDRAAAGRPDAGARAPCSFSGLALARLRGVHRAPGRCRLLRRQGGPDALAGSYIHGAFERALRTGTGGFNDTELFVLDHECGRSAAATMRILESALGMAHSAITLNGVDRI